MQLNMLNPRKALNKAFLKVKPNRSEIEKFKTHIIQLLDATHEIESQIDQLVYGQYGLTEEEIGIVEEAVK